MKRLSREILDYLEVVILKSEPEALYWNVLSQITLWECKGYFNPKWAEPFLEKEDHIENLENFNVEMLKHELHHGVRVKCGYATMIEIEASKKRVAKADEQLERRINAIMERVAKLCKEHLPETGAVATTEKTTTEMLTVEQSEALPILDAMMVQEKNSEHLGTFHGQPPATPQNWHPLLAMADKEKKPWDGLKAEKFARQPFFVTGDELPIEYQDLQDQQQAEILCMGDVDAEENALSVLEAERRISNSFTKGGDKLRKFLETHAELNANLLKQACICQGWDVTTGDVEAFQETWRLRSSPDYFERMLNVCQT